MMSRAPYVLDNHAAQGYGALAAEYDRDEHRTTRILEALSAAGLQRATAELRHRAVDTVLEIGAGTGAFTAELLRTWPRAPILATDTSREMLDVLSAKLATTDGRVSLAVADARGAAACLFDAPPCVIAAGLADPYLDTTVVHALRDACGVHTQLVVTVPSRRWARRERTGRLGVALNTTRFRLSDGGTIFAPSMTYDEKDLRAVLREGGFTTLTAGTQRSEELWSRPEICWALAVPAERRVAGSLVEDL